MIVDERFLLWERISNRYINVFGFSYSKPSFNESYTFKDYESARNTANMIMKHDKETSSDFYVIPYKISVGVDYKDEKSLMKCKIQYPI